jgi:hypothetical protein
MKAANTAILIFGAGDVGIVNGYGEYLEHVAAKFCVWVISNSTTVII